MKYLRCVSKAISRIYNFFFFNEILRARIVLMEQYHLYRRKKSYLFLLTISNTYIFIDSLIYM